MLGVLSRILIVALGVTLIVATWEQIDSTTIFPALHDAFARLRPHGREIRLCSTFAILILCVVIARRDPLFTRLGILSVLVSLTILLVPPREIHQTVTKLDGIRLRETH